MQPVLQEYQHVFASNQIEIVVPPVRERLSEDELLQWVKDVDGVICGDDKFTERVLQSAPRLKVIVKWGTGIDSIDQKACAKLGISLRRTRNAFSEPVSETVLGYVLCFSRQLVAMTQDMRRGIWTKRQGFTLRELTLGVIGVGDIGKLVTRRCRGLGMRVLGHDIVTVPPEFVGETGIELVGKEDILRSADIVTLHCDLNPTSHHLIGAKELATMKKTAYLINTSRGPVVDEVALAHALQSGTIAGVAMDVFEDEPLPPNSPLRGYDNVLLAAHNSNSSPAAWRRVHENSIQMLMEGLGIRPAAVRP
jgi:D-3-phosphoglycerate dehydrogenase